MLARPQFQPLFERVRLAPPTRTAFVCPYDRDALQLAISASFAGFCDPVFVGAEARIRDAADAAGLDIARFPIANTPDVNREATACAIELARAATVRMLVKGDLSNEDLFAPIAAPESGLRSERRLSHAYFMDLPNRARGLLLADAMLNVAPNLAAKRDILQNTIDLARSLGGGARPRAAVLAAVPAENPAFRSTLDAGALKTMARQNAFSGALVEGPLTTDVALSTTAVAGGLADILLAPDMETGSVLYRAILALTGGFAAGIVLGAKVPVIVPTRADGIEARMAACGIGALHARTTAEAALSRPTIAAAPKVVAAADHPAL